MDLFVVNRHDVSNENEIVDEKANIARLLKRIEKKKQARAKRRERLKEKIIHTKEERAKKRKRKAGIINKSTGVDDEFIDNGIKNTEEEIKENKSIKKKLDISNVEGFTVLGGDAFNKINKVKRVLPRWLSNATIISVDLQNLQKRVSSMKELDKDLRQRLKANGIKYFFPVQTEVIPWLLKSYKQSNLIIPRDICVSAPTGSGKTLAFVLPVVQALKGHSFKRIRALVIVPTRDLAVQVFKTFKKYTRNTLIDVCLITGNSPFSMEQKQLIYQNNVFGFLSKADILICTAGRLVDHLKETKGFSLEHLEYLIIDEADKVLDIVQNDWLYHLENHIYKSNPNSQTTVLNLLTFRNKRPPQKLLFSATLSQDPEKLQKLSLFQPKLFTSVVKSEEDRENIPEKVNIDSFVGKYTTPKELTEKYILCSVDLKPLILYEFIKLKKLTKTIIFMSSTESVHRLTLLLQLLFKDELVIEEISAQLSGNLRNTLIDNFSKGDIDIIISTDRLTRGMDFPGVQCVICYAPTSLKTYIHRVGRTARAGELGLAVTLLAKTQLHTFVNVLKQAGKTDFEEIEISEEGLETHSEQYKEALQDLKETVAKEEEKNLTKMKSSKRYQKRKKDKSKQKLKNLIVK